VNDLLLYDQALRDNKLLTAAQRDKMQTPYIKSAPMGMANYGYAWTIRNNIVSFNKLLIAHSGTLPGYKNYFARFIDEDVTVIILSNNQGKWNAAALSRELASIVLNKRYWFWQNYF